MLTCKEFLKELNAFLDRDTDPAVLAELERHVSACPDCWVVCNTTEKTIRIYRGMEAQPLPRKVESRLMSFLAEHCQCKSESVNAPATGAKKTVAKASEAKRESIDSQEVPKLTR